MIDRLKQFLFDRQGKSADGGKHTPDELHIAAATLLLEAAMLDGDMDAVERDRTRDLVQARFALSGDDTDVIMEHAETKARDSVDIYSYLRVLISNFDNAEQVELIEMLWDVICADGVIHDYEANLVRRVTGMTGVTDRESGEARRRAMAKQGLD